MMTMTMSSNGLWLALNCICLVGGILVQQSMLNYLLIYYNAGRSEWYFLFLMDFLNLSIFMFSFSFAYKYFKHGNHQDSTSQVSSSNDDPLKTTGKVLFIRLTFPKRLGMLPLTYLCWLIYSITLACKMLLIYYQDIPTQMFAQWASPKNVLLLTFAGTVAIFIFWVEGHFYLSDERHRHLSKTTVDDLMCHTSMELFDSIIFLDLITPDDLKDLGPTEHIGPTTWTIILFLSCACVGILPTLGLYRLSRIHFGENTNGQIKVINDTNGKPTTRGLGLSIVYHTLRLVMVNIPYLSIRIHISSHPKQELSIFIVKNALGIWLAMRNIYPEIKQWLHIHRYRKGKFGPGRGMGGQSANRPPVTVTLDAPGAWEMNDMDHSEHIGGDHLSPGTSSSHDDPVDHQYELHQK